MNQETTANPLQKYMRTPQIYITLPSEGKYWANDSIEMPVNGEVPVLSMSTRDELVLKSPDALMNGQAVVDVIQSCVPCIKNAWEMPIIDLDAILIGIRIATYGELMGYSSSCPECSEFNEYEIDLKNFLVEQVDVSTYEALIEYEDLKIKLHPNNYRCVNTNNMEIFEQQRLVNLVNDESLDTEQKQEKFNEIFSKMTDLTVKAAIQSVEYIEIPEGPEKITDQNIIGEFISNSNRSVFESIDKHQQKINESIPDKNIKTTCPDCGHEYLTPFTFDQSNFFALAS